jgi:hypothetical protein
MYVNEYTKVCNIANNAAYAAIVDIVQECIQDYTNNSASTVREKRADTAYAKRCLKQFAKTRDVDELVNSIAQQDSYVREYYAYVVNDLQTDYYMGEWE